MQVDNLLLQFRDIKFLERKRNFNKFNDNYIKNSNFIVSNKKNNLKFLNKYDGFVVGSDQIWNPYFRKSFFLDVVKGIDIPTISLSASFGIEYLPKEYVSNYRLNLNKFKKISVREFEGKRIIVEQLGINDVSVLIDPTMMLTRKDWETVSKIHRYKPEKKYILTYILGTMPLEIHQYIEKINKNKNYKVVNLGDRSSYKYFEVGPSEFIDYIKDAELMITDSFHGIVFSSLFETPFLIFERTDLTGEKSMNSRINTFIKHFDVSNRVLNKPFINDPFNMDFSDINELLDFKRDEFDTYVKEGVGYFG